MTSLTAVRVNIQLGNLTIEVFLTNNDEYRLSKKQVMESVGIVTRDTPRWFKSRQLEPLPSIRLKFTENGIGGNSDSISIPDAIKLWHYLGIHEKNEIASSLVLVAAIESIERRADAAFGKKVSEEERNERFAKRMATKQSFWFLTAPIQDYISSHPSPNAHKHYTAAFQAMSRGLFGKPPCEIREELGLGKSELNRDHFGREALRRVDEVQRLAAANIRRGEKPTEAVKSAIAAFGHAPMSYRD